MLIVPVPSELEAQHPPPALKQSILASCEQILVSPTFTPVHLVNSSAALKKLKINLPQEA